MKSAFTLIELLVVLAIIVMLASMLMPILGMARKEAQKSQSKAVLHQVDSALRLFKQEYGAYPYQQHYPNLSAGETFDSVPNHLGYTLGTDISDSNQTAVEADMDQAASAYDYAINPSNYAELPQPSAATYNSSDVTMGITNGSSPQAVAVVLNRMAQERARLGILAGDLQLAGGTTLTWSGAVAQDHSATVLVPIPQSAANPGWAADYLHGQIESRFLRNGVILDAWGHALIYACQVVPGIHGTTMYCMGSNLWPFDPRYFGLGTQGFDPNTGPGPMLKSSGRGLLLSSGRIRLDPSDAGDGQPPPPDASYLPGATSLIHSDLRYSAAPGFESEFELWSSGPDGRFGYWRDDSANLDNIAIQPYTRGLQ